MNQDDYNLRPAVGNDLPFIFDTFLKSYKMSSAIGKSCRNGIFFDNYRLVVDDILESSSVTIACHKDEPSVIFGYIIHQGNILHYIFIKEAFRNLGLAKALYNHGLQDTDPLFGYLYTTHKTFISEKIESLKVPFNPFVLFKAIQPKKEETHG